jgi:hypothetical protein
MQYFFKKVAGVELVETSGGDVGEVVMIWLM